MMMEIYCFISWVICVVTNEAKEIIENALNSPEFIKGMAEAIDYFDTLVKAYKTTNVIVLTALRDALDRRIIELNTMFWFQRIETVENNIMKSLL